VILYYTEHIYLKGIFCSKLSGRVTKSAGGFGFFFIWVEM